MKTQDLPNEAIRLKHFDFKTTSGDRRFMYHSISREWLIGEVTTDTRGLTTSHAQDYFSLTGKNDGFDEFARGWFGVSDVYPAGVIHFMTGCYDDNFSCLESFIKCGGASGDTIVRNFYGVWEQPLNKIISIR